MKPSPTGGNPLIFPLDLDDAAAAREWILRLQPAVGAFKIGYQLFLREGPAAVEMAHQMGVRVFLDLKLHDIPHTVAQGARQAVRMGAFMFNVHASGGAAMMKAAAAAAREEAHKLSRPAPIVLGVTLLTSLDARAAAAIGFRQGPANLVLRLAGLARAAGLDGVVASPHEAARIRTEMGPGFVIVCPGIRPAGARRGDQARSDTPGRALAAGADYLVVGRPIREAPDPAAAAAAILEEAGKVRTET